MTASHEAFVVTGEQGEAIWLRDELYVIKARRAATGGAYSLTEVTVGPHAEGPLPHRHRNETEAFYVLDGNLQLQLDGESVLATPGTFAHVPKGATHTYSNPSDAPARFLVLLVPGGFEGFFAEMGEAALRRELPVAAPPPDLEKLLRLSRKYARDVDLPAS